MQPAEVKKKKRLALILAILGASLLLLYLIYALFIEGYFLFRQEEKKFQEAAEYYYFQYPSRLPKKDGEMVSVTLKELNDLERIEKLMIPKENDTCSLDSWVRVFKEGEEYRYYTYLSCGKYQSNVDHEGPVITLKGDDPYYLTINSGYQELGVESIKDDHDQDIDVSKVLIDSSNVNTKKIGSYKVRYTVYDKMHNRSDVTRDVYVVRNIVDEIKSATDESNTYKGENANNYILFSGMLWRIIKVNDDNSIKLILDDNVANMPYRNEGENFENSNLAKWLNNTFYQALKNASQYVKQDSTWCENTTSLGQMKECDSYSNALPVGMLSMNELLASIDSKNTSYLYQMGSYWLLDKKNETNSFIYYNYGNSRISDFANQNLAGVRPVINLKTENLYVMDGDGSGEKPYKLDDYTFGRDNDYLNTRYIGEYVNYSGQFFRISGFDEEGNIKLIGAGTLTNSSTGKELTATYQDEDRIRKFNPLVEGNLGYILNNELGNYVADNLLIEHEFTRPYYEEGKKYDEYNTETFRARFSIPSSYDLFSGVNSNNLFMGINYYLMDVINKENHFFMVNSRNGIAFDVSLEDFKNNAIKAVIYISKNARISSGQGTVTSPYYIK